MKNRNLNKIALFYLLLIIPYSALADDIDESNLDGDVQDIPTAPIDDYIQVALVIGIGCGYVLLRKKATEI